MYVGILNSKKCILNYILAACTLNKDLDATLENLFSRNNEEFITKKQKKINVIR